MTKTYFQTQAGRKMRVYQIVADESAAKKRRQVTIAVINVDGNKIPRDVSDRISPDDLEELQDRMRMLREQVQYEDARKELKKLPDLLAKATTLLENKRLTIGDEQRATLDKTMNLFLKQLKSTKA